MHKVPLYAHAVITIVITIESRSMCCKLLRLSSNLFVRGCLGLARHKLNVYVCLMCAPARHVISSSIHIIVALSYFALPFLLCSLFASLSSPRSHSSRYVTWVECFHPDRSDRAWFKRGPWRSYVIFSLYSYWNCIFIYKKWPFVVIIPFPPILLTFLPVPSQSCDESWNWLLSRGNPIGFLKQCKK